VGENEKLKEKLIELWVQSELERAKSNREIGIFITKLLSTLVGLISSVTLGYLYKHGFTELALIGLIVSFVLLVLLFWFIMLLLSVEEHIFEVTLKIENLIRSKGGMDWWK